MTPQHFSPALSHSVQSLDTCSSICKVLPQLLRQPQVWFVWSRLEGWRRRCWWVMQMTGLSSPRSPQSGGPHIGMQLKVPHGIGSGGLVPPQNPPGMTQAQEASAFLFRKMSNHRNDGGFSRPCDVNLSHLGTGRRPRSPHPPHQHQWVPSRSSSPVQPHPSRDRATGRLPAQDGFFRLQ